MSQDPYQAPQNTRKNPSTTKPVSPGRAEYNIVSDTVTGVNVRGSDNKLQAIFVIGSMVLFAVIGAVLALVMEDWNLPWFGGALIGAFLGMVVGVFTSGIFLMFYRAARHIKGQHD